MRTTSRFLAVSALAAILVFGAACSDDDDSESPSARDPVGAATATVPTESAGTDAEFTNDVREELTELRSELTKLETEANSLEASARAKVAPMLEDLRDSISDLEAKLADLTGNPNGTDRDEVKSDIEEALDSAKTQLEDIRDELGS